jgi:hypothetical protein
MRQAVGLDGTAGGIELGSLRSLEFYQQRCAQRAEAPLLEDLSLAHERVY